MAKPEATFISYINKRIDEDIHRQSMYTPYSGGTPDVYYEDTGISLWVEYKFTRKMPGIYRLGSKELSALQKQWCNRAHANRQNVAVVCGFGPKDVVVFTDGSWEEDYIRAELEPHIISRAQYISDLNNFLKGNTLHLGDLI